MADISDVETALIAAITGAIYPNGSSSPSTIVLANGTVLNSRIFGGWPLPGTLDADMAAGVPTGSAPVIDISVYAQPGMERNTTRYPQEWQTLTKVACTITGTVSANQITIGGTITAGHYVTVQVGNQAYSYAALASDTTATVAAALASLMTANITATASGNVITVPLVMGGRITVRTAAPGTSVRELDRMLQRYCVTIWAPNNACRVAAAKIIRPALAAIDYLLLPDGYTAELKYESSTDIDRSGKQSLACRDIFYWLEYPTTQTEVSYPITTFSIGIEPDPSSTVITPLPLSSFTPARTVIN